MSDSYGVVHGVAHCLDCDWSTESYKNAQAISAKHARKYGHRVEGELGIAFSYDYRGSASFPENHDKETHHDPATKANDNV